MSRGISIDVRDAVTPALARLTGALTDSTKLNAKIGGDVLSLVRDHLTGIAEERHATAEKLGASPSKFWGNPDTYTTLRADADAAHILINHAGIGRVAHDVTILPGAGKQWLTIPLIAAAYNQRAAGMAGLFFVQPKGKPHALLGRRTGSGKDAQVTWVYLLVKSVHQHQDRTLLPPDEAFQATAGIAAGEYIDAALAASAGGPN